MKAVTDLGGELKELSFMTRNLSFRVGPFELICSDARRVIKIEVEKRK